MFSRVDRWVILAIIFFIVWKFVLITVMWQGREIPPEPDDSFVYSGYINSVRSCSRLLCDSPYISLHSQSGYRYLSYRLWWGNLAKVLPLDSVQVYHLSFYSGTVLLVLTLLYLMRNLTANPKLVAWSLGFLALFSGTGGIHGFFWVVPSFFAVLLFFLLFGLIVDNHKGRWLPLVVVVPIFVFMHPLSLYFLVVIPLYWLFYWGLTKTFNLDLFKKVVLVVVLGGLVYLPVPVYLQDLDSNVGQEVARSVRTSVAKAPEAAADEEKWAYTRLSRLQLLRPDYLNWLFPHPLAAIPFLVFSYLVFRFKEYKLVALYSAGSTFVVTATLLHPEGYRSLVLLWPITFIWYAFGFWYLYVLIRQKIKLRMWRVVLTVVTSFGLAVFVLVNLAYSLLVSQYFNINDDFSFDTSYVTYLLAHTSTDEAIEGLQKVIVSYGLNSDLIYRPQRIAGKAKYFIDFNRPAATDTANSVPPLEHFSRVMVTVFKGPDHYTDRLDDYISTAPDGSASLYLRDPSFLENMILEKSFGAIDIYRNPDY